MLRNGDEKKALLFFKLGVVTQPQLTLLAAFRELYSVTSIPRFTNLNGLLAKLDTDAIFAKQFAPASPKGSYGALKPFSKAQKMVTWTLQVVCDELCASPKNKSAFLKEVFEDFNVHLQGLLSAYVKLKNAGVGQRGLGVVSGKAGVRLR